MSRSLLVSVCGAALLIAFASAPVRAADYWDSWGYEVEYAESARTTASADGGFQLRGSIGVLGLEAHEYVFATSGSQDVASHLIWESLSPMASLEMRAGLPEQMTLKGRVSAAMGGIGQMEDFDWLDPWAPSYHADDWSDYSRSLATLDWYVDASVAVGRDVMVDPAARLNVNVGLKYTDVRWTASGGSYIYSTGGLRDDEGTFPNEPVVTYRQQIPVAFAGLDVEATDGQWTFEGGVQGGVSFLGLATDDHWLRDPPRRFYDRLQPAPYLGISGSLAYEITDALAVFASAAAEMFLLARADTDIEDGGVPTISIPDAAGASLATLSASAGLKGKF